MKVGVLGGGQLGRMLSQAGHAIDVDVECFDASPEACAGQVGKLTVGSIDDVDAVEAWAKTVDVVTYEWENFPAALVGHLQQTKPVLPNAFALTTAQDRWSEKKMFTDLEIPVGPFRFVRTADELRDACDEMLPPIIVKTRSGGYDGKGQVVVDEDDDAAMQEAIEMLEAPVDVGFQQGVIAEQRIDLDGEISVIGVRSKSGDIAVYPVTHNTHRDGILRVSVAPANVDPRVAQEAQNYLQKLLRKMEYVGVLALELFVSRHGLLANEMAPRVHNSGHWTIEGAETSQFENHLRAVAGMPLGSTQLRQPTAMVNCIGSVPNPDDVKVVPGTHLHDYGKAPRPGRKVGHITITGPDQPTLETRLKAVQALVGA
jgi:5-(carboxyamino)imidazole ribonucleotide synthase